MLSLDALFSILPILLMLVYILNITALIVGQAEAAANKQIMFDKLVSIADYAVAHGLAKKSAEARWPNLVETLDMNAAEIIELKKTFNLKSLSVSAAVADGETCIYRLVVLEQPGSGGKEIKKIYICGA